MARKKPGVMLYFDETRAAVKTLNPKEKGLLLDAILDYAEHGECPKFYGKLETAWAIVQLKIDKDDEAYLQTCRRRKAAAEARWGK